MKFCFSLPMPMDRLVKTRVEPITIEPYCLDWSSSAELTNTAEPTIITFPYLIPNLRTSQLVFTDMSKVTPQASLNCGVSSINVPHMQWALQKAKPCLILEKKQMLYEQRIKTDPVLFGWSFGRQPLASAPDIWLNLLLHLDCCQAASSLLRDSCI